MQYIKIKYSCLFICCLIGNFILWGQESRQIEECLTPSIEKVVQEKYQLKKDKKRLLINTAVNSGIDISKFFLLRVTSETFSNWDKEATREKGYFNSWKENVKVWPPESDIDSFFTNGILHSWGGGVYYMSARNSGYDWRESFVYSALLSTFLWEYGIEALEEIPTWNDLVITPIVGSFVGECFYNLKNKIIANDRLVFNSKILGTITLLLIDPVNEITDLLDYKVNQKVNISSTVNYSLSKNNGSEQAFNIQIVCVF